MVYAIGNYIDKKGECVATLFVVIHPPFLHPPILLLSIPRL